MDDEDIGQLCDEELDQAIADTRRELEQLEQRLVEMSHSGEDEDDADGHGLPQHCVPIRCDVRSFGWAALGRECQFDVVMMDPPWRLASAAPTRGVALGYSQLHNREIAAIPLATVQTRGFLFLWVINARYAFALELFRHWGYELVDNICWVKTTVNRRLAKSHGFYLQHAKETCMVGLKGSPPPSCSGGIDSDVIFSQRRGQSQKPDEIYDLIERLVPNGKYLEVFARINNLRNFWVSIGLEL